MSQRARFRRSRPHIRVLLVCGEDTQRPIGHYPGQSLIALVRDGTSGERQRIVGATGTRPLLQNVDAGSVAHFRRQVQVVDQRGLIRAAEIAKLVEELAANAPGPLEQQAPTVERRVPVLPAAAPERLLLDPAGSVVIVPDSRRRLLVAEQYQNSGTLQTVIEGRNAIDVMATLLREGLVTRLDHAAYLGRELFRAEQALDEGRPYVQDRAPGQEERVAREAEQLPRQAERAAGQEERVVGQPDRPAGEALDPLASPASGSCSNSCGCRVPRGDSR